MGLDVITGKHFEELMLRIQDGVKQEERASFCEESDTFHLVFIAGVARGLAEAGCRIEAMKLWLTRTVSMAAQPGE